MSYPGAYMKSAITFGFFLAMAYPLIIWVTMANACRPLSYYWNQFAGTEGVCINTNRFFLALRIINMIADVIGLAIPFPRIVKLQMATSSKVAVVCIASVIRITSFSKFESALDITHEMGPVFIWSTIEPSIAIVCACLPHLAPLAKKAGSAFASRYGKSTSARPTDQSQRADNPGNDNISGYEQPQNGGIRLFNYGSGTKTSPHHMKRLNVSDDVVHLTDQVTVGHCHGLEKARSI
ncbi:hypothetical protein UA08_07782 [Talaromyces atroroseus]|uniref:Rhodopsin domain-containing protein n=1 Tax=Talaromyces atroroseus TaxID=1441469 RepID=A0A225AR96_TALAT|nr:hypothetical protein UA08_07782 [Talaromyces atroroseus]OKL56975.1 hypothetical protein UA08_07782 [Talaromyces atroroseus]